MNSKARKKLFQQSGPGNLLAIIAIIVMGLVFLAQLTQHTRQIKTINYSTFIGHVEKGEVERVTASGQHLTGKLKNGTDFETVVAETPENWKLLKDHKVQVKVLSSNEQFGAWYMLPLALLAMFLGIIGWYFFRQSRGSSSGGATGGPGGIFGIGKSRARMYMPSEIKENFNSVAGAVEAKEELQEVVEFLKDPKKHSRLGAKIPRGILLVGEPGNGKTLLAKAVAGEANCPFFSVSGSDFVEVFAGVGASRVRDLFAKARKHAPVIIFIDEIDAVGRQRGVGFSGGHDEREQTLNQLLSEMDGFQTSKAPVIIIAATNRADVLDKALLRPGRFDRRVHVPYPDLKSREMILNLHSKGVKIDPSVDMKNVARGTTGFTGADLANLINEAALHATKSDREAVMKEDFEEARDKIMVGKESKTKVLSEYERKVIAYHEAGHALVRLMIPEHTDPLHKVTIVPRGTSLGVTWCLPEREKYIENKEEMEAFLATACGGRAAEELVFNSIMTGAYSDFTKATQVARRMVCSYGMHPEVGTVVYEQQPGSFAYSQQTAADIDAAVKSVVDKGCAKARQIIEENRDKLNKLAEALLDRELLYAAEVYELLGIEPRGDLSF